MVPQTRITEEPLDLTALTGTARRSDAGAAIFVGTVRDHANRRAVQPSITAPTDRWLRLFLLRSSPSAACAG